MRSSSLSLARSAAVVLVSTALALGTACGGADEGPGPDAEATTDGDDGEDQDPAGDSGSRGSSGRRSKTPDAERIGSEPTDSKELGALYGEIRFSGEDIERFPIGARYKSECKHHPEIEHLSDINLVRNGRIQNVYVYIKSGHDKGAVPAPSDELITLDQRGCFYTPHLLAMRAGQKLQVKNSDPTTHNVNVQAPRNGVMGNKNMGRGQPPLEYEFPRRELGIKFKCDIHPWMGSVVHVQDHPWFALTDAEGKFRIPDVPPGKYVVEALHERLGKSRGSVTVEAGVASGFTLTIDG